MLIKKKLNSYKIYTYNGIHKGLLNMKIYIFIIIFKFNLLNFAQ